MTEPPGVSLRGLGLQVVEGLACPEGGTHNIPDAALAAAVNTRRPTSCACVKCEGTITLAPA